VAVAALAALSRLQLSEALRRQLGVPPGPLTLRRAWPRGDDRMALELVTAGGVILAGQSFTRADATSDNQRAARVARRSQTTVPTATAVALPGTGVVLQAGGADRRLPALATVVADPAATLVAHRPERRAVVRLDSDAADEVLAAPLEPRSGEAAGVRYAKLVRPGRSGGLVKTAQAAFTLACMRTPELWPTTRPAAWWCSRPWPEPALRCWRLGVTPLGPRNSWACSCVRCTTDPPRHPCPCATPRRRRLDHGVGPAAAPLRSLGRRGGRDGLGGGS